MYIYQIIEIFFIHNYFFMLFCEIKIKIWLFMLYKYITLLLDGFNPNWYPHVLKNRELILHSKPKLSIFINSNPIFRFILVSIMPFPVEKIYNLANVQSCNMQLLLSTNYHLQPYTNTYSHKLRKWKSYKLMVFKFQP